MNGTHAGHFLVEMDGVAILEATEVTGLEKEHEHFTLQVGTRSMPTKGRGKWKVGPVTMKHAEALNSSFSEIARYFDDYEKGFTTEKRNFRVIQLREDGRTPHSTYELVNCVPGKIKPEDKKADSKDAAFYTVTLEPEDLIIDTAG